VRKRRGDGKHESRVAFWLKFILHQIICLWGVIYSVNSVTFLAFTVLRLFGKTYPREYGTWILIGRPYFPIHIALGIFLGWVFGRHLWHRSMVWVWALPFAALCYAFITIPTITPGLPPEFQAGIGESRFSHYFGWGCGPWNNCVDQIGFTLKFYIAAAYSIGALLAHRLSRHIRLNGKAEGGVMFICGIWFFLAAVRDSYYSVRSVGWHWIFLPYESVCAGIGVYLALLAVTMWRGARTTSTDSSTVSAD
jgi:hypothetical protein